MSYKIIGKYIKDLNFSIPNPKTFFLLTKNIEGYKINIEINSAQIKEKIIEISTSLSLKPHKDFADKKRNIEDIISIQKEQVNNENTIIELTNSISNLSNIRDKNIEQFKNKTTKNKFNNSKILIRNLILGLLWSFVFYKLYLI